MLPKTFLPLAAANVAFAQTLTEVLTAQNSSLSTLVDLLQGQPDLLNSVAGLSDITILAPSNEAFTTLLSDPAIAAAVQADPSIVPALLSYHVINGTYYAGDITALDGSAFVPTLLTNETFTTVEGGQRVEVRGSSDGVSIFSGGGAESKVSGADFNFTGGTLHIIDKVLTIPSNLTTVLTSTPDLSSLTSAVTTAELVEPLESIKLTLKDGDVLVNEAKVVIPNVLVKNGVVHVIDGVLIPKNLGGDDSATPSASGTASGSASATSTGAPTNSAVTAGAGMTIASFGVALAAGGFAALLHL